MEEEIFAIVKLKSVYPNETSYNEIYGWRGRIYCITQGMDYGFDEIPEKDQKAIYNCIKAGKYDKRPV